MGAERRQLRRQFRVIPEDRPQLIRHRHCDPKPLNVWEGTQLPTNPLDRPFRPAICTRG